MTIDPFELLGLSASTSSVDDAAAAFRDLALVMHPDKGGSARDMAVLVKAHQFVKLSIRSRADVAAGATPPPTFKDYCEGFDALLNDAGGPSSTAEFAFNSEFERAVREGLPVYSDPESAHDDAIAPASLNPKPLASYPVDADADADADTIEARLEAKILSRLRQDRAPPAGPAAVSAGARRLRLAGGGLPDPLPRVPDGRA